jgi:hypothetical protein
VSRGNTSRQVQVRNTEITVRPRETGPNPEKAGAWAYAGHVEARDERNRSAQGRVLDGSSQPRSACRTQGQLCIGGHVGWSLFISGPASPIVILLNGRLVGRFVGRSASTSTVAQVDS